MSKVIPWCENCSTLQLPDDMTACATGDGCHSCEDCICPDCHCCKFAHCDCDSSHSSSEPKELNERDKIKAKIVKDLTEHMTLLKSVYPSGTDVCQKLINLVHKVPVQNE